MKISNSLVTLALAAGMLTMTPSSSAYAVETCFGLAPTIVTTPGESTVKGTEGDDVIVDNHGRPIVTLGGNDAVCSVGSKYIDTGAGDDRVTLTDGAKGNFTFLGVGSDVYVGSDADDRVAAGAFDSTEILEGDPGDVDTISTLGGADRVHSLAYSYPNADVIDLGAGPDSLRLTSTPGATFAVEGGAGGDGIEFEQYGVRADLTLDLGTGEVGIDAPSTTMAPATAMATGFEGAYVSGRDQVTVYGTDGGDSLGVDAKDARVFGSGGNDDISISGCGAVARGGGGDDELESGYRSCSRDPIALYGGGGRDTLRGRLGPDILIGNTGHDTARGGRGRDRCQAEVKVACER